MGSKDKAWDPEVGRQDWKMEGLRSLAILDPGLQISAVVLTQVKGVLSVS